MRSLFMAWFAALLLGISPALATGNLSCHFGDRNLKFGAEATFSHGVGEGFVSFGGTLEVLAKGVPDDLRTLDLDLPHLTQRWLYARELKLRLHRERTGAAPHGYVELVVEAKQAGKGKDEIDYRGTYVLTVHHVPLGEAEGKTLTLRGRAACSVG
jgi:hypothetical protein